MLTWPNLTMEGVASSIVSCRKCARLVAFREDVARLKVKRFSDWDYWGKPIPGFGDPNATLMIVGLAPAAHGGNRTGRVFTGDKSGDFLVSALYRAGFANKPRSTRRDDGLVLNRVYLTAAVKCAPPDNKPTLSEFENCSPYLRLEIQLLERLRVILCLGQFAYDSTVRTLRMHYGLEQRFPRFSHGLEIAVRERGPRLFASFHPSPRNTQTGKLSMHMFLSLLSRIRKILGPR